MAKRQLPNPKINVYPIDPVGDSGDVSAAKIIGNDSYLLEQINQLEANSITPDKLAQTITDESDKAPSNKAVYNAFQFKADKTQVKKDIEEAIRAIPTPPLASTTQNGLLSKEHYKLLEDMATNFETLNEQVKRIADAQELLGGKNLYETTIVVTCDNTNPIYLSNFAQLSNGVTNYRAKFAEYEIVGKNTDDIVYISASLSRPREIVTINADAAKGAILFSADSIDVISDKLTNLNANYCKCQNLDVRESPNLTTLAASYNNIKTINVSKNTGLTTIGLAENELIILDISKNTQLSQVSLRGSSAKKQLNTLITSSVVKFMDLNIMNTNLTKDAIVEIGNKWESRIGMISGNLRVSTAIIDAMSTSEKLIFTNKNINLIAG